MVMFVWGADLFFRLARPPVNSMEVFVVGKQWMWKVQHPEGVREINEGLRRIAAARNVTYVDIYTPFAVEGCVLDPATTYDDLHLNGTGYARWRDIIASLVLSP